MAAPERRSRPVRHASRAQDDTPLVPIAPHRRPSMELARVRRRFAASIAIAAVAMTIAVLVADRLT
jgi:hypothetical protein